MEALKNYNVFVRRYRNRRIGDFLKELHLTEGRNTGIRKILNAMEKNGSPLPEFITDEDHSYFITRLFVREGFDEYQAEDNGSTTKETTKEIIIEAIMENPSVTVKELAVLTGLTGDGIRYHINKMRKDGILSREGSTKAGRWVIQKHEW